MPKPHSGLIKSESVAWDPGTSIFSNYPGDSQGLTKFGIHWLKTS